MSSVTSSASRIKEHTDEGVNRRIWRQTQANVAYYAAHPEEIDQRLRELDAEWDTERWLEVNSSALSLVGLTMALLRGRKWLVLPLVVQGFFLQHGVEGYCPPLPIFRRAGVRSEQEIEMERAALKSLRGDYERSRGAEEALRAAER